jgi:1-aminocyclopropane-1-carboxylate deaminase/D-cysteine desulfhydrase-like pyridoxal-dependent ACC family enzyme
MIFSHIPRVRLYSEPTPLEHAPGYGQLFDYYHLYVKRDDAFPLGMGGNKVRTLEFLMGEAISQGANVIVAAGGLQSNQCRLAAAACAKMGLECVLVHGGDRPTHYQGNMLLNHLSGAHSIFLGPVDEDERGRRTEEIASDLKAQGKRPYIINNSGRGALGYALCALELHQQADARELDIRHVGMVGAMAATATGFVYGTAILGHPFHVHVISVEYEKPVLRKIMGDLWDDMIAITHIKPAAIMDEVMTIYDEYLGDGYGANTHLSLQAAYDLPRTEGIFLESIYTSKTLGGLRDLIERKVIPGNEASCFVHTGGLPSLFAQSHLFQPKE